MKKSIHIINRNSGLLAMMAMLLGLGFYSCSPDDHGGIGNPIIERVRNTDPSTADSAFVSATLGSTLAILGQNLAGTEEVYLNDYPLGINPAYVTNNSVIVMVSDSVPTIATDPNVPNKLRLVTPRGEATFDFQTLPPSPQVLQVKNQYVRSGDELTVYGRYFYFVDTVHFPGEDVFVTEGIQTNSSGTTLRVTVPENLDFSEDSYIQIVSQSGGSATSRTSQIFNGTGMIADFDTDGALVWPWEWGWGVSGEMIRTSQPGIQALEGNFAGINQSLPGNWGWNNDKLVNLAAWSGDQIFPTTPAEQFNPGTPAANFDLRWEVAVNTESPIEGVAILVWYPDQNGNELEYLVPLNEFVRTTDGSWHTFSVNLTRLTNGSSRLNTYGDFLAGGADGVKQLRLVVFNTTPNDVPVVMGIDNIRVVRAVN